MEIFSPFFLPEYPDVRARFSLPKNGFTVRNLVNLHLRVDNIRKSKILYDKAVLYSSVENSCLC